MAQQYLHLVIEFSPRYSVPANFRFRLVDIFLSEFEWDGSNQPHLRMKHILLNVYARRWVIELTYIKFQIPSESVVPLKCTVQICSYGSMIVEFLALEIESATGRLYGMLLLTLRTCQATLTVHRSLSYQ
jgi:hypothetical protein